MPDLTPHSSDMPQDVIDFRTRTVMPESYVDDLWAARPGFLGALISSTYQDIYGRLRKRYTVPFAVRPEIVVRWMTRIATPEAYRARGIDSSDEQITTIDADRTTAYAEIKEAADSQTGLFDLPVDDATDATAVTKGGPLSYSEPDPYIWADRQVDALCGRVVGSDWRYRP